MAMLDILTMLDIFNTRTPRIPLIYLKVTKVAKPHWLDMLMVTFKTTSV